uniref:hypothetical protein n=1 Tax=Lachnospira eligens TaxID=39485 RepID=UPI00402958AE
MEQINENFIKELLNYQLPYVNGNVNFWMVRTKKGYFYDEYINDSYVALGWNIIDLSTDIGSIEKEQLEVLKENIKNIYGDKRPGQAISKCKKFMYELKIGDIIMIPGIHDDKIAFAEVGEYYEREDLNEENEIEVTIKVIKVINYKDLHVKLLKVLSSYQGICNLNEYGKYILDMIYPIYYWREAYSFQMHINTSKPIDLTSITKVMQCVDCYMKKVVGDNELSIMLNLNSKGVISFTSGKRNLDKTYNAKKDEEKYRNKGKLSKTIIGIVGLY